MSEGMDVVASIRTAVEGLEGVPHELQTALDDVFSRAEAEVRSRAESSMTDELNDSAATLPLPGYGGNGSGVRAAKRASRSAERATRGRQPPPREPPRDEWARPPPQRGEPDRGRGRSPPRSNFSSAPSPRGGAPPRNGGYYDPDAPSERDALGFPPPGRGEGDARGRSRSRDRPARVSRWQ